MPGIRATHRRCATNSTSPAAASQPCAPPARQLDRAHPAGARGACARIPSPPSAADSDGRSANSRRCIAARHRHVRQRPGLCHGPRTRRRRARLRGRRSGAAVAAHGRDHQRRRFARPDRGRRQVERRSGGGRDVPGSAADLRHAARARARMADRDRARRRAPSARSRHLCAVHHRRVSRHAARLQLHRSMRRVAGGADGHAGLARGRAPSAPIRTCPRSSFPANSTTSPRWPTAPRWPRHSSMAPQIRIANSFHVNALPHARSACAAQIVRRFIDTLEPGRYRLRGQVPPLRLVPRFAVHASQLEPAGALPGNRRRRRGAALGERGGHDRRRCAGARRRQFHAAGVWACAAAAFASCADSSAVHVDLECRCGGPRIWR